MLIVSVAETRRYGEVEPVLQLVCALCRSPFRSLQTAFLAYPYPVKPGARHEGQWVHRRCVEGRVSTLFATDRIRLQRGDYVLKSLIVALTTPAVPYAVMRDVPRPEPLWVDDA